MGTSDGRPQPAFYGISDSAREYSPLARHGLTDPETAVQHCNVSANAEIHG